MPAAHDAASPLQAVSYSVAQLKPFPCLEALLTAVLNGEKQARIKNL